MRALAVLPAFQVSRGLVVSLAISCLVALAVNSRMEVRPGIFAFVLALLSLNLIVTSLRSGDWRWLAGLVPLGLLWGNPHGSFLPGPALPRLFPAGAPLDDLWSRPLAE